MEKQIKAKRVGNNLIVMVGKDKLTKKVTAEEAETVLKQVEKFNKKPNEKLQASIVKAMAPKTLEEKVVKETKKAAAKGVKKQIKKATKKAPVKAKEKKDLVADIRKRIEGEGLTAEETSALEELLKKGKKVEEAAPAPAQSTYRRPGEH